jgi:hypothetical protein
VISINAGAFSHCSAQKSLGGDIDSGVASVLILKIAQSLKSEQIWMFL